MKCAFDQAIEIPLGDGGAAAPHITQQGQPSTLSLSAISSLTLRGKLLAIVSLCIFFFTPFFQQQGTLSLTHDVNIKSLAILCQVFDECTHLLDRIHRTSVVDHQVSVAGNL